MEDSLVSRVGLLSGIVVGGVSKDAVILTGIVLIFVEALSMGVGSLLSEHSVEVYIKQGEVPLRRSAPGGLIMFFSYFVFGFIPLFPYLIIDVNYAFWVSIAVSLLSLFLLGAIKRKNFSYQGFSGRNGNVYHKRCGRSGWRDCWNNNWSIIFFNFYAR